MIKYCGYVIIESEEDFKENFHLGDGINWESTTDGYVSIDYYHKGEPITFEFPCAYEKKYEELAWVPCSIEKAKQVWNEIIPQRIENLQNFLKKVNETY